MTGRIIPTPKQKEAHRVVTDPENQIILYGGAIRGGKSFWLFFELFTFCAKYERSRWIYLRESMPTIERISLPTFRKVHDMGLWPYVKKLKSYGGHYECEYTNGSVLIIMPEAYDKDPQLMRFHGLEINGGGLDEMPELQEETFNKVIERAGSHITGENIPIKILGTANPNATWVRTRIYDPWRQGNLPKGYAYVPAKITDNPHVPKEYLESLKQNLPSLLYEKFVQGDWDVTDNDKPWAYAFKMHKHVSDKAEYRPELPIYLLFDFNVEPATCGLNQFTRDGRWQFDEIHVETGSIYDVCHHIKTRYGTNVIYRVSGDASGWAREKATFNLTNMYDIIQSELRLTDYQIDTPRANPNNKWARTLTNFILEKDRFLIHPRCKYTILDLQNCRVLEDGNIDKKNSAMSHHLDHVKYFFTTYFGDELNQDYA